MARDTRSRARHPGIGRWLAAAAGLLIVGCLLGACQPAPAASTAPSGAAAAAGAPVAAPASAPPSVPTTLRKLRVGYAAVTPRVAPLWVAGDEGYFQRRGLDVEVLAMRNAQALQAAMLAREIELAQGGLSATLAARAAGGDVVLMGGLIDRALGHLVAQPGLRRPEDLRGKRLGVQSIGGTVWTRAMLALDKLGLEPERDGINAIVIGDEPTLAQAMLAGAIDVTPVGYTVSRHLQAQGYMAWDLAELGVAEVGQAFVASATVLAEDGATIEQFLRAMGEAVAFMKAGMQDPARRERVLAIAAQHLSAAPADMADELDAYVPLIPRNLLLSRESMQAVYAITLRDNPELARISLDAALDEGILKRLDGEGFFRQLYASP